MHCDPSPPKQNIKKYKNKQNSTNVSTDMNVSSSCCLNLLKLLNICYYVLIKSVKSKCTLHINIYRYAQVNKNFHSSTQKFAVNVHVSEAFACCLIL